MEPVASRDARLATDALALSQLITSDPFPGDRPPYRSTGPVLIETDDGGVSGDFEIARGFDPLNPDQDIDHVVDRQDDFEADGLSNASGEHAGTDPNDPDTDDHGLLDGAEFGAGSLGPQQDRCLH